MVDAADRSGRMVSVRLLFTAILLLGVLLTACDAPAASDSGRAPAWADPGATATTTLTSAYQLIGERYAEPVDMQPVLAAGTRGLWQALAQSGVIGTEIDVSEPAQRLENWNRFRARFDQVSEKYYSKISPVDLAHAAIEESARSLDDCHTAFMSAQQFQEQVRRLNGEGAFGGIGVVLRRTEQREPLTIVEVFPDGPAAKAGVRRGDQLVGIDGADATTLSIEEVVRLVRGPEGSPVSLSLRRAGDAEVRQATIIRARVVPPVVTSQVLPDGVGYIHLYSFPIDATREVEARLRELERSGVRAIILDLRDNSGGALEAVTTTTSLFVPTGVLFTQIARSGERKEFRATGEAPRQPRPLVVLVNKGTSSGGEILAAAIKERGAGRLVGTKTAGCVSTGQMFQLPDGSALELAVGRIVTGQGAELNKVGVTPNDEVELSPRDLAQGRDPQLEVAQRLLGGR